MAQLETVYVHRNAWTEPFTPGPEVIVWNAHRPLRGEFMWQGRSRWGTWYASARTDSPELANCDENNRTMDAREVRLVDNMEAITVAGQMAREQGREAYGLSAYVRAYPGAEGAKMFVETYDLPWDDADTTADALLAALETA